MTVTTDPTTTTPDLIAEHDDARALAVAALAILRAPARDNEKSEKFADYTCPDCRDAGGDRAKTYQKVCGRHRGTRCSVCGTWATSEHSHLTYMGHAAVTNRLLDADPLWWWEPMALDSNGLPLVVDGELWIRLHVAGMTRLGVGDAQSKTGPNAVKERIGDAIRNAAMRFGVGLDLWHKGGPLVDETASDTPATEAPTAEQAPPVVNGAHMSQGTTDETGQAEPTAPAGDPAEFSDEYVQRYAQTKAADLARIRSLNGCQHFERFVNTEVGERAWAATVDLKGRTMTLREAYDTLVAYVRGKAEEGVK